MSLSDQRRDYARAGLDEKSVASDPLRQFLRWLEEAGKAGLLEPNAMTLATADRNGVPSARLVLLKEVDERGFVFYTDSRSPKGRDLAENPVAALVFWWGELERQVRIVGTVARLEDAEAEAYYRSRPEGSRISSWASEQSAVVPNRGVLEAQWARAAELYAGREIPKPPYWGGFRITPTEYEFWQGRPNRLHDRIRFVRGNDGAWVPGRLSP